DCPLNADSGVVGRPTPVYQGLVPAHQVSRLTRPASSKVTSMLSLLQPNVLAGTPGRSSSVTTVPNGLLSLIEMSPTHVCVICTRTWTWVRIAPGGPLSVLAAPAGVASGTASGRPVGVREEPIGMLKLDTKGPPSLVLTESWKLTVERHATCGSMCTRK